MGNFKFIKTNVPEIIIIENQIFGDNRGFFMETYKKDEFAASGITTNFIQDNHSMSTKGVLRGLHFQKEHTQAKLVRVLQGRVFDVGVDVRKNSPTFGCWAGAELNDENKKQLFVPEGFAHGFLVLSETAQFSYKCGDIYSPANEGGVRWNDPDIGIVWPKIDAPINLSEKDAALPLLKEQTFEYFERWLG